MDYQKHYTSLCNRAKERQLDCYTERHHVLPKCIGGDDNPDNIVVLTPEEHYIAHQLLVKIYPKHTGLLWAAIMMTGHSTSDGRANNKIYGWLKRRYQNVCRERTGEKSGSFGKSWYHNPETLENIKCVPGDEPEGFVKGRKMKSKEERKTNKCIVCGKDTGSQRAKYCEPHREQAISEARKVNSKRVWHQNKDKMMENLAKGRKHGIKRPRDSTE